MISLKRNDKIIVLIAVIVIVLAGIGVALYTPPKTENLPPSTTGSSQSFNVSWPVRNGTLDLISGFVNKKTPTTTGAEIPQGNVISVTFNMSWVDDHTTFFGRRGLDTLSLEVTTPDGDMLTVSNVSAPKTKEGSVTIVFNREIIPPVTVKADDTNSAQVQLTKKPYYDDSWTKKNFSVKVSVRIGEMRLIPRLLDKGNVFSLEVTYQYKQGVLNQDQMKSTGNGSDTPPQDPWEPPYMSMIISTGCGRFV